MQKWCPEPLVLEKQPDEGFEPLVMMELSADELGQRSKPDNFISEAGLGDDRALMAQLSQHERAQLFEMVEQDVVATYAEKFEKQEQELATARETEKTKLMAEWQSFSKELVARLEEEQQEQAQFLVNESANLALAVAEKIVRCQIELDPKVLVRSLETVLHKLEAGQTCKVHIHPADAEYLESMPDLVEKFRISAIKTDRRIERGGCIVEADGQDWDATIRTQFDTLGDMVRHIMTVQGQEKEMPSEDEPKVE